MPKYQITKSSRYGDILLYREDVIGTQLNIAVPNGTFAFVDGKKVKAIDVVIGSVMPLRNIKNNGTNVKVDAVTVEFYPIDETADIVDVFEGRTWDYILKSAYSHTLFLADLEKPDWDI